MIIVKGVNLIASNKTHKMHRLAQIHLAIFSQEIILKMVFAFTFCCSGQSLSWLGVGAKVSFGLILVCHLSRVSSLYSDLITSASCSRQVGWVDCTDRRW